MVARAGGELRWQDGPAPRLRFTSQRKVGGLPKRRGHGWFFDTGGGGLPNPTESTMWGKGSSGACCYLSRDPQGKRGGATCLVLTSADWFAIAISA